MKKTLFVLLPSALLAAVVLLSVRSSASARERDQSRPLALPVAEVSRVSAEGRVVTYPGAEVVVGSDFRGRILRLLVEERSRVRKGDLLAEIDASEEKAALAQARARISEAAADLKLSEFEVDRAARLLASKVGSQQALDKAQRDRDTAQARRATAVADVERLQALVAKSRIVAPIAGVVVDKHVEAGETVDRGARLVTLADLERVRVEAEVDEADSSRVTVGATVTITAEGEEGKSWKGRVEEIPDSVTTRRLKPQDPGKPSDTRVLLVKVAFAERTPLKLGRRVDVAIESGM